MQFEYDPERLIEEVKKRPAIWDYDDPEYRLKNIKHKVWHEIVNELITPDVVITKGERRELEMQLQKKWKGIRDCFIKYVANPSRQRRPYIYMKQLNFLYKNQDAINKEQEENSTGASEDKSKQLWKAKKKTKLLKDESTDDDSNNDDNYDDSRDYYEEPEDVRPAKVAKLRSQEKPAQNEFLFANVETQLKTDSDDADKMFLLSLLPHLKAIPEDNRLNVKLELMQVLQNANYNAVQDHKLI